MRLEAVAASSVPSAFWAVKGESVRVAVTKLQHMTFGVLPVKSTRSKPRRCEGVITWGSVARALMRNAELLADPTLKAEGLIDETTQVLIYLPSQSILDDVIEFASRFGFVLRGDEQGILIDVVFAEDLLKTMAESERPFGALRQIETGIREALVTVEFDKILACLHRDEDEIAKIKSAEWLYFSEYAQVLGDSDIWDAVAGSRLLDKSAFGELLREVAPLRNEIMHFRSVSLSRSQLAMLLALRDDVDRLLGRRT